MDEPDNVAHPLPLLPGPALFNRSNILETEELHNIQATNHFTIEGINCTYKSSPRVFWYLVSLPLKWFVSLKVCKINNFVLFSFLSHWNMTPLLLYAWRYVFQNSQMDTTSFYSNRVVTFKISYKRLKMSRYAMNIVTLLFYALSI